MTVNELIEQLSKYPGDLKVVVKKYDFSRDDDKPYFDPAESTHQLTGNGCDVVWTPVDWSNIGEGKGYQPDEVDERVVIS